LSQLVVAAVLVEMVLVQQVVLVVVEVALATMVMVLLTKDILAVDQEVHH
tara:strand:+ start:118 stop:267 length:150 start_codon:yes stop_codon:yes gene_type:complete